jgi:predicted transcriptional regulator
VEDTWRARDIPVLSAAIELLERSYMVTVSDIAEQTGLEKAEVARSLDALHPAHVDFRRTETGGDPTFWYVLKVTPEGRRAVGQWPTAEGFVDHLVQAFRDAAASEQDSERQYQLSQVAALLSGSVRDVALKAATAIVGPSPAAAVGSPAASESRPWPGTPRIRAVPEGPV